MVYEWAFGDGGAENGAMAVYTYTASGSYTASVTATNGAGSVTVRTAITSAETYTPNVEMADITASNVPPVANDDGYDVYEDETLIISATVGVLDNDEDVPADTLTVMVDTNPAHGDLMLAPDGSFVYTPSLNLHDDDAFTYTISDDDGGIATATVRITVTGVNDPPELTNPGSQTSTEGVTVSIEIEASDVESDTLTFSAGGLPPGLSIVSTTGLISGALSDDSAGPYTVTVVVSDGQLTDSVDFDWTVNEGGPAQIYIPLVVRNYGSALDLGGIPSGDRFWRGRPRWRGFVQ